jgi:DNA repair protein RadD
MSTGSPGMSFRSVLDHAPPDYARSLIGREACALLDLLNGGSADEEMLRHVAASAVLPEVLVAHDDAREALVSQLPPAKRRELAERLGWDHSVGVDTFLTKTSWSADQRRILLGFLGMVVDRAPTPPPAFRGPAEPVYGMFPHQRRAAQRVQKLLYDGERRAVLHLPTGVGKTRTAMNVICDHLRRHEPTLVVWLARGRELLEQAGAEFERAWQSLGNRTVTVVRMWGDTPADLGDVYDGLVVLGLDKAVSAARAAPQFLDDLALRATFTTFDEAHQAVARTYRRVVDALTMRRDASLLGLTATPGRTWTDPTEDERLSEFFARQKVMLEIDGHDNPVTGLIEQGYLARPTFRTVAAESGLTLGTSDRHAVAEAFDLPEQLVQRLADSVQWNLQVARTVLDLSKQHRRILLFAASVEHCRLLAAVLSGLGLDAEQVTGESSTQHRDRVIARFKGQGSRPMVLSNFGVLTTGFDAPAASAAVIARPTKSLVLYSQMVGRIIRGPLAGGTPTCDVVTVVDPDLPGFGDIAEAFSNWEDVWTSN